MISEVLNEIKKKNLIQKGEIVLAGVSGGADSVCLLLILHKIQKEIGFSLEVIHVEHGIRGKDSKDDAVFVKELCKKEQIPCRIYEENVLEYAHRERIGLEEAARIRRYACYENAVLEKKKQFPHKKVKIALAHHADDNAETILFQMVRGSGIDGLCGMAYEREWKNCVIIRPLLLKTRAEIELFLKQYNQEYRIDETNMDTVYSRNRIRHQVMPELKKINEQAVDHMNQSAFMLRQMWDYVQSQTEEICQKYVSYGTEEVLLKSALCTQVHEIMQTQAIYRALVFAAGSKKDIASVHVKAVHKLFFSQTGRSLALPYNLTAERVYEGVQIQKHKQHKAMSEEFCLEIPKKELDEVFLDKELEFAVPGGKIVFRQRKNPILGEFEKKTYTKCLNYDKIKCALQIRTRKSGDFLMIDDFGHTKKLKEYFINEKIPAKERDEILLIAQESHILWIIGKRISACCKVDKDTEKILEIQFLEE